MIAHCDFLIRFVDFALVYYVYSQIEAISR